MTQNTLPALYTGPFPKSNTVISRRSTLPEAQSLAELLQPYTTSRLGQSPFDQFIRLNGPSFRNVSAGSNQTRGNWLVKSAVIAAGLFIVRKPLQHLFQSVFNRFKAQPAKTPAEHETAVSTPESSEVRA